MVQLLPTLILWEMIIIGERCYINNTIVDKNCRIGNDVRLNGGKHLEDTNTKLYTVKDGIIVVKKGSIIPDGFEV